jgi:two-component system response regulator RegX3
VLLALGVGGDDYIRKPYSLSVLLAKVQAVLKRHRGRHDGGAGQGAYAFGGFVVDFDRQQVSASGVDIGLKSMEFKLLAYLVKNRQRVVTKEQVFLQVWQEAITTENTLNVHIRRLREKTEDDPSQPRFIKTVWGAGYRFEGP